MDLGWQRVGHDWVTFTFTFHGILDCPVSSLPQATASAWHRTRFQGGVAWNHLFCAGHLTTCFWTCSFSWTLGASPGFLRQSHWSSISCDIWASDHWISGGKIPAHGYDCLKRMGVADSRGLRKLSVLLWTSPIHSQLQLNPLFHPFTWHLTVVCVPANQWRPILQNLMPNFLYSAYFINR